MLLDKLVNKYYQDLSENDLYIINVINYNSDKVESMKIQDLAELAHTSTSSVHRLSRKLGFDGYSELKAYLKINKQSKSTLQNTMEILEHDISQTFHHLEQLDFDYLSQLIDDAPYIYIYGTGTAQSNIAREVQRNFLSMHKRTILLTSKLELLHSIDMMKQEELLLVISLSGETKNFEDVTQRLRTQNLRYISITTLRDNAIAKNAMFNIYVNSTEFYLYNGIENSSFLPYHLVFDVIVRKYSLWKSNNN